MKRILITGLIGVIVFSSCTKKNYLYFSEKQLVFVNYSKGQDLKFVDTASLLQTLSQDEYHRQFREQLGVLGKTGNFIEEYEVAYRAQNGGSLGLHISVSANSSVSLEFASYFNLLIRPDSLQSTIPSMSVNGKTYTDIYTLKMYKNYQDINNSDTATLFHNKEYGVIQLLFPDGKKIMRVD